MATPHFNELEEGIIIIKRDVGRDNRIVPLSEEFILYNGEMFDKIIEATNFNEFVNRELNRQVNTDMSKESIDWNLKKLSELKEDVKDCKTKITIKIELEKYE